MTVHYITLLITVHYITLHYITSHYITYIHTYITSIHVFIDATKAMCPLARAPLRCVHTMYLLKRDGIITTSQSKPCYAVRPAYVTYTQQITLCRLQVSTSVQLAAWKCQKVRYIAERCIILSHLPTELTEEDNGEYPTSDRNNYTSQLPRSRWSLTFAPWELCLLKGLGSVFGQ